MIENDTLSILQYNVNNSRTQVMIPLFESEGIAEYDILLIQEPWRNSFQPTTNNRLSQHFELHYMPSIATRVCLFINKRIALSTYSVAHHSKDLVTMKLRLTDDRIINIHNLYNSCRGSSDTSVFPLLKGIIQNESDQEHFAAGDYNIHHPIWGGDHVRADAEAYELIVIMESLAMKRVTPRGLVTWSRDTSQSTIDLAFTTQLLRDSLIEIKIAEDMNNHSDHFPIKTLLNLRTKTAEKKPRRNFDKTDVKAMQKELETRIATNEALSPTSGIHDNGPEGLNTQVQGLVKALQKAIEASTPYSKPSSYSKPGFTAECKSASLQAKNARRRYQEAGRPDYLWDRYKKARNRLGHIVQKAMKEQYRKDSEERCDTPQKMWATCKWTRNRTPKEACIPALYTHPPLMPETDPAKKATILLKKFFPPPPTAILTDMDNQQYDQNLKTPDILLHEIIRAIEVVAPNKAPGDDEITNRVLKWTKDIIAPHLLRIFNASLSSGYCPEHFRNSVTVALRKANKDNYSTAASYRPIALLNTISKLMEYIMAKRLSYLAETHNLLPRTHMGARRAVSTEHALHYLVERIHSAWSKGKIATALLLDVAGAFDNVIRARLLHNLRRKGIDERLVQWLDSFLSRRKTILRTREHTTEQVDIEIGTPQGSPLSAILYLFYNASLLEGLFEEGITACGFVDDIGLLVEGSTTEANCQAITDIHDKHCIKWTETHGTKFNPGKYQLCHFTRQKNVDVKALLALNANTTVKAKTEVKYLGVTMDTKLNWKAQINNNKTKALKSIGALTSLAGTTWGARLIRMRQMMHAVFIPQLTHGCSVWYTPHGEKKHLKGVTDNLAKVQSRAERAITGAYRATSKVALNIETHSLPMHLRLDKLTSSAAVRLITSPVYEDIIGARSTRKTRSISPLEMLTTRLEKRTGVKAKEMEKITPFAAAPWWIPPNIRIMPNKKTAEQNHKEQLQKEKAHYIYSDGSGINGKIGAAAVSTATETPTIRRTYLGPSTFFTVYSAELYGIAMAASIGLHLNTAHTKVIICIDNQAAIRAIYCPAASSGQHIVKFIVWIINALRSKGQEIELHWVPAHIGIEGNELADVAAKQATGWRQKKRRGQPYEIDTERTASPAKGTRMLKSATKTVVDKMVQETWIEEWQNNSTGRELYSLVNRPKKSVLQLHEGLSKIESSLAVQLRTGKIGLRSFLYKRKQINSPLCLCLKSPQTIRHVLFECRKLNSLRLGLWKEERRKKYDRELRLEDVLTNAVSLKKATNLIKDSGLIGYLRAPNEEDDY